MIVRAALVIAAVVLAGASLVMSLAFVSGFQEDTLRRVFVAVAIASCALKLSIPAFLTMTGRAWRSSGALVVTWAIAFVLDASFVGAFMSTTRDAGTRELQAQYDARRTIERELGAAVKRRDDAAKLVTRDYQLIKLDLDTAERASGKCETAAHMELPRCSAVTVYKREMAAFDVHKERAAKVDELAARLAATKEVVVYPEAARFGKMVRSIPALEFVEDGHVATVLWLLMLVLFEFGAMTAVKSALANDPSSPAAPAAPPPRATAPAPLRYDALYKLLADGAAGSGPFAPFRQHDGRLKLSQKNAAPLAGMSARAFGDALRELSTIGRVDVVTGSRGTFARVIQ